MLTQPAVWRSSRSQGPLHWSGVMLFHWYYKYLLNSEALDLQAGMAMPWCWSQSKARACSEQLLTLGHKEGLIHLMPTAAKSYKEKIQIWSPARKGFPWRPGIAWHLHCNKVQPRDTLRFQHCMGNYNYSYS